MRRPFSFRGSLRAGVLGLGLAAWPAAGQSTIAPLSESTDEPPSTSSDASPSLPPSKPEKAGKAAKSASSSTAAQSAATIARLAQSNQELLDLLKKQQAVLEDIQYDRRLQNRQISSLEERLQESLQENAQLQAKVAKLEEQISLGPATPGDKTAAAPSTPAATPAPFPSPVPIAPTQPPPPPATYLPPPDAEGAPGTKSWHRLFTLSGTENRDSDYFHVESRQWRVLWHNQDHPGDAYANTSALFISAFPKGDTIPQKVCSKLGSGGDSTELDGPGDFYLKVEASGGKWELAVEDFK
jgi:hypothetical protein